MQRRWCSHSDGGTADRVCIRISAIVLERRICINFQGETTKESMIEVCWLASKCRTHNCGKGLDDVDKSFWAHRPEILNSLYTQSQISGLLIRSLPRQAHLALHCHSRPTSF
jgi:hypothetical protein